MNRSAHLRLQPNGAEEQVSALGGFPPRSDHPAVVDGSQEYSYSALDSLSAQWALRFQAHSLGPLIAISVVNSFELLAAFLALRRLGASIILLPTKMRADVACLVNDHLRPSGYVVGADQLGRLSAAVYRSKPVPLDGPGQRIYCLSLRERQTETCEGAGCALVYKVTSGSAGRSKVVVLGTAELEAEARNVSRTLALRPEDRVMAGVSMLHSYGFDLGLLAPLWTGSTMVIQRGFVPSMLDEIGAGSATVFLGIPRMYEVFLSRRAQTSISDGPVRYWLSCTGPLARETVDRFHDRFGATICQHYGTSETGALTTHLPSEVLRRPTSVGLPMDGVSIELVDEAGHPHGGRGFVFARSRALAKGYAGGLAPEQTRSRSGFVDGGFQTGDLGAIDDDGYLYLGPRTQSSIHKYDVIEQ